MLFRRKMHVFLRAKAATAFSAS